MSSATENLTMDERIQRAKAHFILSSILFGKLNPSLIEFEALNPFLDEHGAMLAAQKTRKLLQDSQAVPPSGTATEITP